MFPARPDTETCGRKVKVQYLREPPCAAASLVCICVFVCESLPEHVRLRAAGMDRRGGGGSWHGLAHYSVLLQDQVFQLVGRAEEEGRRLPVPGDELPHRRDLRGAELGRGPAPAAALTVTVGAGGRGVRADGLHTQICGTCGHKAQDVLRQEHL